MGKGKKRNRRQPPANSTPSFLRNLGSGDFGLIDRARTVVANLMRRNPARGFNCCGHYGDPGC